MKLYPKLNLGRRALISVGALSSSFLSDESKRDRILKLNLGPL